MRQDAKMQAKGGHFGSPRISVFGKPVVQRVVRLETEKAIRCNQSVVFCGCPGNRVYVHAKSKLSKGNLSFWFPDGQPTKPSLGDLIIYKSFFTKKCQNATLLYHGYAGGHFSGFHRRKHKVVGVNKGSWVRFT